jgi:hypothetical protein
MSNLERLSEKLFQLGSRLREWAPLARFALASCIAVHFGAHASASDSAPLASNVVRSATESNWKKTPSAPLSAPGKNSVTLDACPPGVIATEPDYYVYISGTGHPEPARVTGGTCKGDGHPGTLEFTTSNAHSAGYVISSASGGIQEASIAARYIPTNPDGLAQSGRVVIPPGEYDVFASISIHASNQTVDFGGAILNCYTADNACIFVGDSKSSNDFQDITLISPRGRPMITAGTKPFIEVNAEQTRIFNVAARKAPKSGSFGSYVQVDDDQAFLLDGLDTDLGGGVTCNPTYCGAVVMAPGPFKKFAAVGWLKNLNLSLECGGKGVEWLSGNGLKISDSVIQGWSVFGVRVSNQRGGYTGLISDNMYFETSPTCGKYSPYGNVGNAALIAEGIQVRLMGLGANTPTGIFPNWGEKSGSHDWLYWVVPVHEKFGDGVPLPAGYALTNGSGTIIGTFPKIAGASSYKILKMEWDQHSFPRSYPQGTGKVLLTTIPQSSCATLTCSFTDSGQQLSSYTNVGESASANVYMPRLDFWPGAIVLSPNQDVSAASHTVPALMLQADALPLGGIVTTQPAWAVAGEANTVMLSTATPPAAANIEAMHTNGIAQFPGATIMPAVSLPQVAMSGYKGRLNFGEHGVANKFTPVITLGDSNWGKTWARPGHRPPADVNDLDLGYEGNIDVFYNRAQNEIRDYIGKFPDGRPQEKLSASAKTFNVPVTINGDLTVTGKCDGCGRGERDNGSPSNGKWAVSLTGQKAAIATANLCAASACGLGQYRIVYYMDSATVCTAAGKALTALTISWKDETGTRNLRVPLTGTGVVDGNALSLGTIANFGSGNISLWSAGNAPITYATSYADCSGGTAGYSLRITLEKLQ